MGIQINGQTDTISAVDGTMTFPGTVTYEDVSRINVVGVVTATGLDVADTIVHNGDSDTKIRFPAADTFTVETAGSERVRVDSTGRIGIGTDNPNTKLHVSGTVQNIAYFENNKSACLVTFSDSTTTNNTQVKIGSEGNDLRFDAGGNEKARITSGGLFGLGTTPVVPFALSHDGNTNIEMGYSSGGAFPSHYLQAYNRGTSAYAPLSIAGSETAFFIGSSEKMRLDSSGRLLVGTSSARTNYFGVADTYGPSLNIECTNNSNRVISFIHNDGASGAPLFILGNSGNNSTPGGTGTVAANASLGFISFQGGDGTELVEAARITGAIDGTPGANDMPGKITFHTTADGGTAPTERMRLASDGTLRTFMTGSAGRFHLATTQGASGSTILLNCVHSRTGIDAGGTASLRIYSNGDVENTNNSYGTLSDIKLKENIVNASSQWDDLKALQVRKFNFKEETGHQTHTQIGLVAQEVELVSPGLVSESPDRDEDGNDLGTITKSVKYSVLYMKSIKALQEAMERIETLEQRLSDAGIA